MSINCDIIILGGGINGAAIAADAAMRGYRVFLIEQKDFASGTSWASTKLIHGGLRYLQLGQFGLVKKALMERTRLYRNAPLYVKPLELHLISSNLLLKHWYYRTGLWLYDSLDKDNPFPRSRGISLNHHYSGFLKRFYRRGLALYDAQTDDVRMTLANVLQAKRHGANCLNYATIKDSHFANQSWTLSIEQKGKLTEIQSRYLINATGPWVNETNGTLRIQPAHQLKYVKGSHLVIDKILPGTAGLMLPTKDNRIVFILPYLEHYNLVGTTECIVDGPSYNQEIHEEERDYILKACNRFLKTSLTAESIRYQFSGIRPLIDNTKTRSTSEISRDYAIVDRLDTDRLLMIYGGKLTTHRQLAEDTLDSLEKHLGVAPLCPTHQARLPGTDFEEATPEAFLANVQDSFCHLPKTLVDRLFQTYGTLMLKPLSTVRSTEDLGRPIAGDFYEFELDYLKKNEWLSNPEDLFFRRLKLGLTLPQEDFEKIYQFF